MKRRRKRINKYNLTEDDLFIERLKRANKSPLEKIAESMSSLSISTNGTAEALSNIQFDKAEMYTLKDLYNNIKE